MCVLVNVYMQQGIYVIMFGSLTVFTQSCVYSWHRIEHMLTLKKIHTSFYGQIIVIMNDCFGSSKTTLSCSNSLILSTLRIFTVNSCALLHQNGAKQTQPREKAQGLKSRGNQGQSAVVLSQGSHTGRA